jgi:hypothetical protein
LLPLFVVFLPLFDALFPFLTVLFFYHRHHHQSELNNWLVVYADDAGQQHSVCPKTHPMNPNNLVCA